MLTESDLDENVMSNGNCHGFAGLVLGLEKEGIPVNLIQVLDVHYSGAIAVWECTRQQRAQIAATPK